MVDGDRAEQDRNVESATGTDPADSEVALLPESPSYRRNVMYQFLQGSEKCIPSAMTPTLVRSNSYTLQDIDRQRSAIQASVLDSLDQTHPGVPSTFQRGRRMSRSLPELRDLRHLPTLLEVQ